MDKGYWYREGKNSELVDGICVMTFPYYNDNRNYIDAHVTDNINLINETRDVISTMINLAEMVIGYYNELNNETITEDRFVSQLEPLLKQSIHNF